MMSSQRGNVHRSRPQKHQNRKVFKNDLHDTNIRTKRINQIQIARVCPKCKSILEWKIKYKKYKLIRSPRSCNKCNQKAVKEPYHTVCQPCAKAAQICPKCEIAFIHVDDEDDENCVNMTLKEKDGDLKMESKGDSDKNIASGSEEEEYCEKLYKISINLS